MRPGAYHKVFPFFLMLCFLVFPGEGGQGVAGEGIAKDGEEVAGEKAAVTDGSISDSPKPAPGDVCIKLEDLSGGSSGFSLVGEAYAQSCPSSHPYTCGSFCCSVPYCCEATETCCSYEGGSCCSDGGCCPSDKPLCCPTKCCPPGYPWNCPSNGTCYQDYEAATIKCGGIIQQCN